MNLNFSRVAWPRLVRWYAANKRALPWRGAASPYEVWVSETMLQQTRIEAVVGYYARFLAALPTVEALAAAPQEQVLKLWEGLGYYSRARNLHAAAKRVAAAGAFPTTRDGWAELPGIGPYTAAALASICNNEPNPVVDGNVARVCTRLCAWNISAKDAAVRPALEAALAAPIAARRSRGDFNQALMELGETICTPQSPACARCPLATDCAAHALGTPEAFPAKAAPKTIPERCFIALRWRTEDGAAMLLSQRPATGLLGGLWELPMVQDARTPRAAAKVLGLPSKGLRFTHVGEIVHVFSHFRQLLEVWDVISDADTFTPTAPLAWRAPADVPMATASARAIALCARS